MTTAPAENNAMSTPVAGAPAAIADAGRELKALENELTALEEQWLELSTQIEEIENGQA